MELAGIQNVPVIEGMHYPIRPNRHAKFALERQQFGMGHDAWLGSFNLPEPSSWNKYYHDRYKADPTMNPASTP